MFLVWWLQGGMETLFQNWRNERSWWICFINSKNFKMAQCLLLLLLKKWQHPGRRSITEGRKNGRSENICMYIHFCFSVRRIRKSMKRIFTDQPTIKMTSTTKKVIKNHLFNGLFFTPGFTKGKIIYFLICMKGILFLTFTISTGFITEDRAKRIRRERRAAKVER